MFWKSETDNKSSEKGSFLAYIKSKLRFNFSLYLFLDGIEKFFDGHILWEELPKKDKQYIYAFHPHGVQPFTVVWIQLAKVWRKTLPGIRFAVLTASVTHFVPIMRDILQWLGCREVSRQSVLNCLLRDKISILLVPGGQREMMESQSKQRKIVILKKHLGFLKIALQTGVEVIPVLSFGEVEVMDFIRMPSLQNFFISRVGLPVPFFPYGMFGLPIPRPVPVTVVMGKPLKLGHFPGDTLTLEDLEKAKDIYFDALEKLFYDYKRKANCDEYSLSWL